MVEQAHAVQAVGGSDNDIGRRIRRARQERGLSLAQLGGDDLSRSFLSLVELGKSRISLRALSIVAQRLELPMSYFLEGSDTQDVALEIVLDSAEAALARREPRKALTLLQDLDVPRLLRPRYLWLRGYAYMAAGLGREAMESLRAGIALADVTLDTYLSARLHYTLGGLLYSQGTYDEALIHLRRALDMTYDGVEDPSLVAKITVCLGHILYARGDVNGALEHYARASELFGSLRDLNSLASIYSGLSLAYQRKGDMTNALRYSRLSLGAYEAQHDVVQSARELNNLAVQYTEMGDLDRAQQSAQEAIFRAHQVGDREIEAGAHSTLAAVFLRQQRSEDAAHEAGIAEEMAAGPTSAASIDAWTVQAALADAAGQYDRVDRLYQQALDATRATEMDAKYADIALAYSLSLKRRGEVDRALEFALEAAQGRPSKTA